MGLLLSLLSSNTGVLFLFRLATTKFHLASATIHDFFFFRSSEFGWLCLLGGAQRERLTACTNPVGSHWETSKKHDIRNKLEEKDTGSFKRKILAGKCGIALRTEPSWRCRPQKCGYRVTLAIPNVTKCSILAKYADIKLDCPRRVLERIWFFFAEALVEDYDSGDVHGTAPMCLK